MATRLGTSIPACKSSLVTCKLNGWNSRNVATITGRHIREEAGRQQTFDLVSTLRVRRLKWVGHVLRMAGSRFVKQALQVEFDKQSSGELHHKGSVLMDVPRCGSFTELVALAGAHQDHDEWGTLVRELRDRVSRVVKPQRRQARG